MTRTCLFVAYAYPPISSPGAVRVTRMIRGMANLGWSSEVVTVQDGYSLRQGGLEDPLESDPGKVHRFGDPVARAAGSSQQMPDTAAKPGLKTRLKGIVKRFLFPDRSILWAIGVFRKSKAMDLSHIDVIHSTSPNASGHLIGWALSRRLGIPWVAEFRDPMSWLSKKDSTPRLIRWGWSKVEAWVVKRADRVVVVSEPFADYFRERHAARHIFSIPNGVEFDVEAVEAGLEQRAAKTVGPNDPIIAFHAGSLYGGERPPAPVIRAAAQAASNLTRPLELHFAGNDAQLATEALGVGHMVKNLGNLSHEETTRRAAQADCLISLLHDDPIASIGIMSKLFDYIPSGVPVLNLGDPDAALSVIVANEGAGASFAYDDIDGIADWLEHLPDVPPPPTLQLCENWSAARMSERMADLLNEMWEQKA